MSTTTELIGTEDALAQLERETSRFVTVARRSPFAAHVPTYPDFTVGTLTAHIGRGLRRFHAIASARPLEGQSNPPTGPEVVEWLEEALPPLVSLLRETPGDKLVSFPNGRGDQPIRTVAPGLAVEVGVHRWDLESVLGDHAPIPTELAVAEIDKAFRNYAPRLASTNVAPLGGTIEFRANDADLRWTASVVDGELKVGRVEFPPASADTTVTASVEDLALIIWKRWLPPRAGVEVSGPLYVLKRFLVTDYIPDPRTTLAR